ncbi:MAG: glycosyltransferase family 4 protein [Muribaculaceae bacterium]|nr:glycosyltransferase family 4 protein [Muribaculaceae bacterium]
MANIMIIGTNMMNIYNHRLELVKALLEQNHIVSIVAPAGGEEKELISLGVKFIDTAVDNRGTSLKSDLKLLGTLISILKKERPDIVLTFYTKTNIYGGIACRILKIPYIENITGLGTAICNGGLLSKFMVFLYSLALKSAEMVFFQNSQNLDFFNRTKIRLKDRCLLPGSGVSLLRFKPLPYPKDGPLTFLFISRVLKEKGIYEYVEAARQIKKKYPETLFYVIGPYSDEYKEYLQKATQENVIIVTGKTNDVKRFLQMGHCTVFPSFYGEGMANILLESAASGRPVITTNVPGCGEAVEDGKTGYVVNPRDVHDLELKLEKFISLDRQEKISMGSEGRKKMEREFDRNIVIQAYLKEINKILK